MDMTTGLRHPKPAPLRTRRSRDEAKDRAESKKVRQRSKGQCEVRVQVQIISAIGTLYRCGRCASQVHHMISGRGKRAVGLGLLAEHKQHVCTSCHLDITGNIGGKRLVLIQAGPLPVYTDCYRRVRW